MKILFICTHNRCRSILAEAVFNQSVDGIEARSAGSQPEGQVHPDTLEYLQVRGYKTEELKSQSWDEFSDWHPDVVITVCDSAANESCPLWMKDGTRVHWGLPDPSKLEGDKAVKKQAFFETIKTLEARAEALQSAMQDKPSSQALILLLETLTEKPGEKYGTV